MTPYPPATVTSPPSLLPCVARAALVRAATALAAAGERTPARGQAGRLAATRDSRARAGAAAGPAGASARAAGREAGRGQAAGARPRSQPRATCAVPTRATAAAAAPAPGAPRRAQTAEPARKRAPTAHAAWAYEGAAGPQAWGGLKPEFALCANGQRQSPIDIRGGLAVDLEPVQFDYRASGFARHRQRPHGAGQPGAGQRHRASAAGASSCSSSTSTARPRSASTAAIRDVAAPGAQGRRRPAGRGGRAARPRPPQPVVQLVVEQPAAGEARGDRRRARRST